MAAIDTFAGLLFGGLMKVLGRAPTDEDLNKQLANHVTAISLSDDELLVKVANGTMVLTDSSGSSSPSSSGRSTPDSNATVSFLIPGSDQGDMKSKLMAKMQRLIKDHPTMSRTHVSRTEQIMTLEMDLQALDMGQLSYSADRPFVGNKHIRKDRGPPVQAPDATIYRILAAGREDTVNEALAAAFPYLAVGLEVKGNYGRKLALLLRLEEAEHQISIRAFDMNDIILTKRRDFFYLEIDGLEEGRPSLVVGDMLTLRFSTNPYGLNVYEGSIFVIEQKGILFKTNEAFFKSYEDSPMNLSFKLTRTTWLRCHRGLSEAEKLPGMSSTAMDAASGSYYINQTLFPDMLPLRSGDETSRHHHLNWVNTQLNERQKLAVHSVVQGKSGESPFVLFGPPGTGKTATLVEMIVHLLRKSNYHKILVVAGSNSAADHLALKLIGTHDTLVTPQSVVRLLAPSREAMSRCPGLERYTQISNMDDPNTFFMYRVVISTCSNAITIHQQIQQKYKQPFTHCIVDEAGTVIEPEIIACATLVKRGTGMIVLAGDPKQLGPVVFSKPACHFGLNVSFLNRLMGCSPYHRDESKIMKYDDRVIVKLVESYRCCPELLYVNNHLFYNGELKFHRKMNSILLKKMGLNFPVLVHGMDGADLQDASSPSWFNPFEVQQVVKYVSQLKKNGVANADIGIVTPYRKQSESIRQVLKDLKIYDDLLKVSTTEDFQGSEKRVMIVSLVRTCLRTMKGEIKRNFGFVNSPERMNVATSRAKELLIVLGHPQVMVRCYEWSQVLLFAHRNDSYTGIDIDPADLDEVEQTGPLPL